MPKRRLLSGGARFSRRLHCLELLNAIQTWRYANGEPSTSWHIRAAYAINIRRTQ
jgi:hypothetical protein